MAQALSNREKEVLNLFLQGLTQRQIAERLSISHKTVNTYKMSIHFKTGCKETVSLVKWAIRNGLTTAE